METLKCMAAKVNCNLLISNTPLCTTNELEESKCLEISEIQNYVLNKRMLGVNFSAKISGFFNFFMNLR